MKTVITILILLCFSYLFAQEICDNGIDDNNNGLIDLNDMECECQNNLTVQPTSLIPNPSFEDYNCLPTNHGQVSCATDWIQASSATSDYFYIGSYEPGFGTFTDLPLPLPDGEGFVGFFDQENYQEFVGTCLINPLTANESYVFNFNIGFGENLFGSAPINLTFYASTNCANLPFDNYSGNDDCPSNYSGWSQLGAVQVNGINEWVSSNFAFISDSNYSTIVIGANCDSFDENNGYYYLDNLILNTSASFENLQIDSRYLSCNEYMLSIQNPLNYNVQWYKNGIALINQNTDSLYLANEINGNYTVVMSNDTLCTSSDTVSINAFNLPNISILEGDSLNLEVGVMQQLNLEINANNYEINWFNNSGLDCANCEDPTFVAQTNTSYTVEIIDTISQCTNIANINVAVFKVPIEPCIIYAPNVFTPNNDDKNDKFEIRLKDCVKYVVEFSIYNRFGERVNYASNSVNQTSVLSWDGTYHNQQLNSGVFVYLIKVVLADTQSEIITGNVTLLR